MIIIYNFNDGYNNATTRRTFTQSKMDSQYEYHDDTVYSVVPGGDDYGNAPEPEPHSVSVVQGGQGVQDDRPDTSVKACKNVRVVFLHDLSGSMECNIHMMVTGTNEFIQDLKARYAQPCDYKAEFLLITFAGERISVVGEWRNVNEIEPYTRANFPCNGSTPLWDACDVALEKVTAECQGIVTAIYTFTDGDDNNSKLATRNTIRTKVAALDAALHTMLFIGSDPMSAAENAEHIGLDRVHSLNHDTYSTPYALRACTNTIARCVTGETQTPEFNESDIIMSEGRSSH